MSSSLAVIIPGVFVLRGPSGRASKPFEQLTVNNEMLKCELENNTVVVYSGT